VNQVEHFHPTVNVTFAVQYVPAGGAYYLNRRVIPAIIVHWPQLAFTQILQHIFDAPFGFPDKNAIHMPSHFLAVQGGGYPTGDHFHPTALKMRRKLENAGKLRGKHYRNRHNVGRIVQVYGVHVLVGEFYVNPAWQGGREYYRAVRGQVELGLPLKLSPLRVN
jgi:hypothetical protein